MTPPRFGVIPTNGRGCIDRAIRCLLPQVDHLAVIEAGANVTPREYFHDKVTRIVDDSGEVNISKWWNIGIDWAATKATEIEAPVWDVAIINDDTRVPPNWLCYIADDMRTLQCVAACSGGRSGGPAVLKRRGPSSIRLLGCAFVLAGESGIRADESMRWYWSEDAIDFMARDLGGVVVFPECHVEHKYPNGQVSFEMQVMITEDAAKFRERYGAMPW